MFQCHEIQNSDRELAKVRDDIKELEGRLKWTQSKLRMEMDAYKVTIIIISTSAAEHWLPPYISRASLPIQIYFLGKFGTR